MKRLIMKLRFYQWFLAIALSVLTLTVISFAAGFEYTVESKWGDYLLVGRPMYFEYTSTSWEGISWEVLCENGSVTVEKWVGHKRVFLFDKR